MQFKLSDFNQLVELISSEDIVLQQFATIGFRRLLSFEKNPPLQQVIDANLVPKFVQFVQHDNQPKLQFEAAWCLTNIASGEHEHVQVLLEKGALEVLVKLLHSQNIEVIEQAIWALGNIAGDSATNRKLVLNAGACQPIANLLSNLLDNPTAGFGQSFMRNASWTLSNFCRGKPPPEFEQIVPAIPVLARVLAVTDQEDILTDICWALSYISDGKTQRIGTILSTGVVPRLVSLLEHPHLAIAVACLRTIGNLLTGSDEETQQTLEHGCLEALNRLMTHNKKAVRKEVCWSVSNVTAGNPDQI